MAHQRQALEKLRHIRVGALYCDMGVGKTRIALELGMLRLAADRADCILWLCPVSVKQAIAEEVEKHLAGAVYEVLSPRRVRDWTAHIYIAGIESLSGSVALNARLLELVDRRRCFVVCDESSLIKNHRADRSLALWRLGERAPYRLILSGTPITNNVQDLYAQWYFLDSRILGYSSFYSFAANHLEYDPDYPERVVAAHNTDLLTRKMAPYIYQIRKDECLTLPPKSYSTRYYTMPPRQRMLYEDAKQTILATLDPEEWKPTAIYQLFTALQKIVSGIEPDGTPIFPPGPNPRMQLLVAILDELPPEARVIVWCKYRHELAGVSSLLRRAHGEEAVAEFWGALSESARNAELTRFRAGARFLVANKACGAYGLNLQYCHYAIYYDNDFSWATRAQSEERLHRAGQEQNVHIVDIVCDRSIDHRIRSCLQRKQGLVDAFRREIKSKQDARRWIDGEDLSPARCVRRGDRAAGVRLQPV